MKTSKLIFLPFLLFFLLGTHSLAFAEASLPINANTFINAIKSDGYYDIEEYPNKIIIKHGGEKVSALKTNDKITTIYYAATIYDRKYEKYGFVKQTLLLLSVYSAIGVTSDDRAENYAAPVVDAYEKKKFCEGYIGNVKITAMPYYKDMDTVVVIFEKDYSQTPLQSYNLNFQVKNNTFYGIVTTSKTEDYQKIIKQLKSDFQYDQMNVIFLLNDKPVQVYTKNNGVEKYTSSIDIDLVSTIQKIAGADTDQPQKSNLVSAPKKEYVPEWKTTAQFKINDRHKEYHFTTTKSNWKLVCNEGVKLHIFNSNGLLVDAKGMMENELYTNIPGDYYFTVESDFERPFEVAIQER